MDPGLCRRLASFGLWREEGGAEAGRRTRVDHGPAASAAAATSASSTVDPHVDAFRLGYAFGPDGQVRGEGNAFAKGEKVFVSFGIRDTKPGSSTRLVWVRNPAGAKLGEETKALPADPGTVSFVGDTATWSTGEYALEIWVLEPSAEPRRLAATRVHGLGDSLEVEVPPVPSIRSISAHGPPTPGRSARSSDGARPGRSRQGSSRWSAA